jgi:cholesterol oxidase
MQAQDNLMKLFPRKGLLKFISKGMTALHDVGKKIPVNTEIGHQINDSFCQKMNAQPIYGINESLLDIPATAHLIGGCLMGKSAEEGVISTQFQVHGYPGLFVIDGSVLPANPGINPSLTIAALAEFAMSQIPEKVDR